MSFGQKRVFLQFRTLRSFAGTWPDCSENGRNVATHDAYHCPKFECYPHRGSKVMSIKHHFQQFWPKLERVATSNGYIFGTGPKFKKNVSYFCWDVEWLPLCKVTELQVKTSDPHFASRDSHKFRSFVRWLSLSWLSFLDSLQNDAYSDRRPAAKISAKSAAWFKSYGKNKKALVPCSWRCSWRCSHGAGSRLVLAPVWPLMYVCRSKHKLSSADHGENMHSH